MTYSVCLDLCSVNIPSANDMSCVTANSLHYLQSLLFRVKQETVKCNDILSSSTQRTLVLLRENNCYDYLMASAMPVISYLLIYEFLRFASSNACKNNSFFNQA